MKILTKYEDFGLNESASDPIKSLETDVKNVCNKFATKLDPIEIAHVLHLVSTEWKYKHHK